MRIVFFGTPDYVLPILNAIHKKFVTGPGISPIVAVVTQAPKPVGRKQVLTYSPIDKWAFDRKIPVFYNVSDLIQADVNPEVAVLESYGSILKKQEVEYFPKGIINIHPSLLPKWRGASPVPATIIANEGVSGCTAIRLDEKIDHGPILTQFKEDVRIDDTTDSLRKRLFEKSADVITELLPAYLSGKVRLKPQNDREATFTTRITKEEAFIPVKELRLAIDGGKSKTKWPIPFITNYSTNYSPVNIYNFIRAMQPWPQAWTLVAGKRLKLLRAHLENQTLVLDEVQLEGKNPVDFKQFKEVYKDF